MGGQAYLLNVYQQKVISNISCTITTRVNAADLIFLAVKTMQDKNKIKPVGQLYDDADRSFKNPQCGCVYAADGLAPTLNTCGGGQREPKILLVPQATKQGYAEVPDGGVFDGSFPNSTTRRGRVIDEGRISPTLQTSTSPMHYSAPYAIRKLTPRECLRLMDVRDQDIDKMINAGISNAQLYKLAGNSIVVEVIYQIFKNLLIK
jgi:DNA (cytosine-5)-methyltransferase 1